MAGVLGQGLGQGQPSTLSPSQSPETNTPKVTRHIRLSLPGLEQTMAPGGTSTLTPTTLLQ